MTTSSPPIELSIVYETVEDGWIQARVAELPGVVTAAPTRGEARAMVLDAMREYLLSLVHDPPPPGAQHDRLAVTITSDAGP